MKNHTILLLAALLMNAGCQRQSPVELFDDGTSNQDLEIQSAVMGTDPVFGTSDIDSSGLFPPAEPAVGGNFLIEGSAFDSPSQHLAGVLVRGILFDRSSPIVVNRDTVAFKTVNVGAMTLNGYPLRTLPKRYRGLIDTLLGVNYAVVSPFTGGIMYDGSTTYQFAGTGAGAIPPFALSVVSPPALTVQTPATGDSVSASRNLIIRWNGGGPSVRVVISRILPTSRRKTMLQFRIKLNRGGVVVPVRMLQLLPQDGSPYQFSFTSETLTVQKIAGYPYDIVVLARGTQSILLNLIR